MKKQEPKPVKGWAEFHAETGKLLTYYKLRPAEVFVNNLVAVRIVPESEYDRLKRLEQLCGDLVNSAITTETWNERFGNTPLGTLIDAIAAELRRK